MFYSILQTGEVTDIAFPKAIASYENPTIDPQMQLAIGEPVEFVSEPMTVNAMEPYTEPTVQLSADWSTHIGTFDLQHSEEEVSKKRSLQCNNKVHKLCELLEINGMMSKLYVCLLQELENYGNNLHEIMIPGHTINNPSSSSTSTMMNLLSNARFNNCQVHFNMK